MAVTEKSLAAFAAGHGVDMQAVVPLSKQQRLEQLRSILDRQDVPYPVNPEMAKEYYQRAAAGEKFGIGGLCQRQTRFGVLTKARFFLEVRARWRATWPANVRFGTRFGVGPGNRPVGTILKRVFKNDNRAVS